MTYPTDEETFDARVSPEWIKEGHLNDIQALLKRIQDFIGYGGRIHDEAGLVMPVGSIIAYSADTAPSGWLLCDGKSYLRAGADYVDLFAVIGTKYGFNGASYFNVPDFRGYFLRGKVKVADINFAPGDVNTTDDQIDLTAHEFNRDGFPVRFTTTDTLPAPLAINTTYYTIQITASNIQVAASRADAIARTEINLTSQGAGTHTIKAWQKDDGAARVASSGGGDTGEDLGSYQGDALQGHHHKVQNDTSVNAGFGNYLNAGAASSLRNDGSWGVDNLNARDIWDNPSYPGVEETFETRPKNVNVNYIIKL